MSPVRGQTCPLYIAYILRWARTSADQGRRWQPLSVFFFFSSFTVSLPIFVFSIKVMKSVVSLIKDFCFCAIGSSNVYSFGRAVTTRDDGSTNRLRFLDFS